METKKALITGISGGVGSVIAKRLREKGFEVFALVRDRVKAEKIFTVDSKYDSGVLLYEGFDMESADSVKEFLNAMSVVDVHFDLVVLAAGKFEWDYEYKSLEEAIGDLDRANYVTTEVVVSGLKDVYGKDLRKRTILVIISSQAANFGPDHPFRKDEEAYVLSKSKASNLGKKEKEAGTFKNVLIEEPKTIDTASAREKLEGRTDWSKAITPEDYADSLMLKIELD